MDKVFVLSRRLKSAEPKVRWMERKNIGKCIPGEAEISRDEAGRLFNTGDVEFTKKATEELLGS